MRLILQHTYEVKAIYRVTGVFLRTTYATHYITVARPNRGKRYVRRAVTCNACGCLVVLRVCSDAWVRLRRCALAALGVLSLVICLVSAYRIQHPTTPMSHGANIAGAIVGFVGAVFGLIFAAGHFGVKVIEPRYHRVSREWDLYQ